MVYLAHDAKHDRKVALKVMRPELAVAMGADRFLKEIRITANLQHPHILPLFDSGQADSLLYYVMPYVAGETLKEKLDRERRLEIEESIGIGKSVAAALHYAHQQNVVHRDIKPENVMLSGGLPLVADFGIAGALESSGVVDGMTRRGTAIGTPGYSSPEQAAGDPVDGRGDVYALGCLMYEMMTGEPPYMAQSARALLVKILMDPVPSPRRLREEISEQIDATIRRALAKEPEDRFATAAEMATAMTGGTTMIVQVKEALSIAPADRTSFVARDQERSELLAALDDAVQGHGSLVLIAGQPGVGKTRLAEEILLEAQRRELLCFIGHAYEGEGTVPYTPFVETLEYAARAIPEELFREALGDSASEVARIMPKLRTIIPDIPPAIDLPLEQQRRYLFNSYREFVERGTRVSPIVILLDDLQWADESSLLLLEHLAQHVPTQRLLIIGTYRDLESEISPALARTLANLTRQRLAKRITVAPFGEAAVGNLVAALGGENPPKALTKTIFRETEGNAFFVEEVFRDLAAQGELFDADGRWLDDIAVEQLDVPEGVRLVLGRRLDRVGGDVQKVLTACGVVGRAFGHGMIEALDIVSPDALVDALEEAETAHLIESSTAGRDTRYRFSNQLIRTTLVGRLTVPRRRQLHKRIARGMETVYATRLDEHASDYSHHLYEAGAEADTDKVIHFLTIAASRALEGVAFAEALHHLDRALALDDAADRADGAGQRERADLLSKKGDTLRGLGDWVAAMQCWGEALPVFEKLGEREIVAAQCETMGEIAAWLGRFDEWRALILRGLEAVGDEPSVPRARLTVSLGAIDARIGDLDAGLSLFDQAIEMGSELGSDSVVAFSQALASVALVDHASIHKTIEIGERAVDQLRAEGNYWHLTEVLSRVAYCRMVLGDVAECARISADLRPMARDIGHFGAQMLDDMAMGQVEHSFRGSLDRQIDWAQNAVKTWAAVGGWAHFYTLFGSIGLFWRGDWDEALREIGVAVEGFPEGWWMGRMHGWSLAAHAYVDADRASEIFQEQKHRIPLLGQTAWGGNKAFALVAPEGLAVIGDRETAASLYPVALEAVEGGIVAWESGLGQRYLGISAACGEAWDAAEEHFRTALTQAKDIPFRTEEPETRRWYAWMLLQRGGPGDQERARTLVHEAVALYGKIGMKRHVALAEDLL